MTPEQITALISAANSGQPPPVAPPPPAPPPVVPPPPAAANVPPAASPTTPLSAVVPPTAPITGVITPPPAQSPAPAPVAITLSAQQWADYTSTQTRIAELERAEAARAAEAAAAEVRALQAKGEIEQAFALQRQQAEAALKVERDKLVEIETRSRRYALDGELARALGAYNLVPGGAEQLTLLMRDEFTVNGQGETFVVQSKDFRSVADFVNNAIATKYPHFVRALNPAGGTAGAQGTQSAPTGPGQVAPPAGPANLSEEVMAFYKSQQAAGTNPALTGGAVIGPDGKQVPRPAAGFGIHPITRTA